MKGHSQNVGGTTVASTDLKTFSREGTRIVGLPTGRGTGRGRKEATRELTINWG